MRKAAGRQDAGKEKIRKTAETKKTAGKRSSIKSALPKSFDADALLNSTGGMVFVASSDYRIEYMNEAARKKIGRDMTGNPCFKVFHGLEERCPWCTGEFVLRGQTIRQEIQGQIDKRWYSSVLTPLHRENGSVSIQALVFDVTDQKHSQAALLQNEALLRSIHQAAPMGIGVVKSRVLEWTNEQLSRMTGYTAEELRGKSARLKYAEIHRKGTGSIVTVWRRKDGCLIHVYLSSTPIDPAGLSAGVVFTALDVTEKKRAQDELWRSEEKFRTLFENAVMGIFQSTPEGRFLSVNPATARMCGYGSPGEMVASVTDIAAQHYVDPAERGLFIRTIEEQGYVRNFEHRTRRKDGSVFWVSVNARAVRDRRGKITHYEGTHEDIQWRKTAEEALRASEERFSKAFRSNPAPVAVSTIDEGRFIEVNDRFLEAFGYRRDEIIGRTSAELDFWASAESREGVLKKLRETGSVKNVLNHYRTKSGQLRTGLWSGDIIRLGDRDVLLSILHDITERKVAEEKYQSILADIEEFYYETDLRGNLTFFNDAACNIIGYTREELQGKNNRDYTTPETAERMYRFFHSVYRTGEKRKIGDYEIIRKNGSRRVLEISVTLKRDERGLPTGFRGLGRDVTDRVEAEKALRLSEERYRTIFENSVMGIFQSTPEGRYIRVNPAFARIFGYESPEEVVSSITDIGSQVFVAAEDRKRSLAILRETGILERFETRTRRRDGSIIWIAINSRIVRNAQGRTLFIEGVIEDITERKNAAEALRASEERFIKVFQSNPIPMTIATIDEGRLIDVNERAVELSGYSREEMVGRTSIEIGLWACPQERDRLIEILRETGSLRDGMAHFQTRAGRVVPALWSADRVRLGEKEVILTTIHDITDLVEAQEKLRRSEEMYRLLAENVTDVIWTADLNLSFTYVSPSSERVSGWSPSEWMSLPLQTFLTPASLETAARLLREEIDGPVPARGDGPRVTTTEHELYRKNGSTGWYEVSSQLIRDGDGKPVSIIGVTRDIAERKAAEEANSRLERQLRQAQKMEAVGTLAGGIAHDFNNILFAVIGYADLCLQDTLDEESRWNLSQILSACSRAKALVNQILAFSRQVEQERRPFDVVPLAKEAVKFLRSSLPATIDLSLDADVTNSVILGDATQIHQVLMNLCTNAAHAMRGSGGRLRIRIDNAVPPAGLLPDEKGGIRPEGVLHLGVSDTGQGIEPAQLNRIFDPFFTTKAPERARAWVFRWSTAS
jgi:two-component system cell cycle sensor histidine kinase/response regulator CckA